MKKSQKVILAFLGGIDVFMTVATPMFIYFFWILIFGYNTPVSWILLSVTLMSSLFRGIKIGWFK